MKSSFQRKKYNQYGGHSAKQNWVKFDHIMDKKVSLLQNLVIEVKNELKPNIISKLRLHLYLILRNKLFISGILQIKFCPMSLSV